MYQQPLFSVVVANYNNGAYLDDLYQSMVSQDYPCWELVIADDCSTDNSREIIARICTTDRRVIAVHHETNRGVAAAFGTAVANCNGDLIGLLGADDALPRNALSEMVSAFRNAPECSLINSDAFHCDEDLRILGRYEGFSRVPAGKSLISHLSICNFAVFPRWAYERTDGFDPTFRRAADHDLFLKLDEVGPLGYIDKQLYLYRVTGEGVSQGTSGLRAAQMSILARRDAQERRLASGGDILPPDDYRSMLFTYHSREAHFLRKNGSSWESTFHLIKVLKYQPCYILRRPFWTTLGRNMLGLK